MIFIIQQLILFSSLSFANTNCNIITSENICVEVLWSKPDSETSQTYSNTVRFIDLELSSDDETVLIDPDSKISFRTWFEGDQTQYSSNEVISNKIETGTYQNSLIHFPASKNPGKWQFQVLLEGVHLNLSERPKSI